MAGAISYVLKHTIDMERTVRVFEKSPDLIFPCVEGVDLHSSNSFPSGHSSTFFVFCTVGRLFWYIKKNCDLDKDKF